MSSDSPNRSSYSVGRKGDGYMIGTFSQMWTENRRAGVSRAIAGICMVLWMAGSVSTLYGSVAPQWTTPHCPQSHSNGAQHTQGSCAWHCDGIETQASSGRPWGPFIVPTGFLLGHSTNTIGTAILQDGKAIRGPPYPVYSGFV